MSHPDPNGPPDRRPIEVDEIGRIPLPGTGACDPGASLGQPCWPPTGELTALVGARAMGEHRHPARGTIHRVEAELRQAQRAHSASSVWASMRLIWSPGVWHDWWGMRATATREYEWRSHGAAVRARDRNLRPLSTARTQTGRTAESAATGAECAGVQRHNRVPFAAAGKRQRAMFGALAPIARWRGYRAT